MSKSHSPGRLPSLALLAIAASITTSTGVAGPPPITPQPAVGEPLLGLTPSELDDFTIGGWSLGIVVNVGFFTATWVSAASVLGVPGLLYDMGFATVTGWFGGWFFANALIPIIAYKIRRPEFPVRTMPEFMRLRYEPYAEKSGLQVYGAVIMIGGYMAYMTIQIAGIGYTVSALTGAPYELAIQMESEIQPSVGMPRKVSTRDPCTG